MHAGRGMTTTVTNPENGGKLALIDTGDRGDALRF